MEVVRDWEAVAERAKEILPSFIPIKVMPKRFARGKAEHGFAIHVRVEDRFGCANEADVADAKHLLARNIAHYEAIRGDRFEKIFLFQGSINDPDPDNKDLFLHTIGWYAVSDIKPE